jgi:hypothetical protein
MFTTKCCDVNCLQTHTELHLLRYKLITLLGVFCSIASGIALGYLAVNAWRVGEFPVKRLLLKATESPLQFYFITVLGSLVGITLVVGGFYFIKKMDASRVEQDQIARNYSRLYGATRPSILIIGGLLAVGCIAILIGS